jgi:hypothetical protein
MGIDYRNFFWWLAVTIDWLGRFGTADQLGKIGG